jgi:uncharacterized protein (UPF0332 family)
LHEPFRLRQRADYQEMAKGSRDRAEETLHNAESFVARIRKHLAGMIANANDGGD